MILVLNNRDSFVFNLARYVTCAGADVMVIDSDRVTLSEITDLEPDALAPLVLTSRTRRQMCLPAQT